MFEEYKYFVFNVDYEEHNIREFYSTKKTKAFRLGIQLMPGRVCDQKFKEPISVSSSPETANHRRRWEKNSGHLGCREGPTLGRVSLWYGVEFWCTKNITLPTSLKREENLLYVRMYALFH